MKPGSRVRKLERKRGWPFVVGASILKPPLLTLTSRTWIDGHKLPATGGCVVVLNHISYLDPLIAAHFVYDHGRLPRYLAKASLFRNKYLRRYLDALGQIPVERLSRNAMGAYDAAVRAVREGECIIVYPEGTLTRDPDLWPMRGKSGAARIALETGCPVIPVGQWGSQQMLYPYARRPHLLPRTHIVMKAGDPVALEDLRERPRSAEAISQATERIMAALTDLVADIRGEQPPAQRFDPKAVGVQEIGNPHAERRHDHRRKHQS